MAAPRRRPPSPPPPRQPKLPPLTLAPMRSRESVDLDQRVARGGRPWPPFVRWDRFMAQFVWKQGEHLTTIGPTGSGKTVLNRELLKRRDYVVVLGVKNRDPELYAPFQRMGYKLEHSFDPQPPADAEEALVLFVPRTEKHGAEGRAVKARRFRQVLNDIYDIGDWCVYADDIQYLTDQLRLGDEFEELWMLGRSEKVTVAASSQEPVNIPVMAYGQATHLFLFKNPDDRRAQRMGELAGVNRDIVRDVVLALPDHEFLYVNKSSGQMLRSKVLTRR
jgi:hypothetical protein